MRLAGLVWGGLVGLGGGCQFDAAGASTGGGDDDDEPVADASASGIDAGQLTPDAAPIPKVCPADWTLGPHGCYLVLTMARSFTAAQAACVAEGGYLAVLASLDEDLWIRDALYDTFDDFQVWIGLSDAVAEGSYVWSDGSVLGAGAWAGWDEGEPNDEDIFGDEDCVELHYDLFFADGWNDELCGALRAALCEHDVD